MRVWCERIVLCDGGAEKLTRQLLELFDSMDSDGSKYVDWDEFSTYCCEGGEAASRHVPYSLEFRYEESKQVEGITHVPRGRVSVSRAFPTTHQLAVGG